MGDFQGEIFFSKKPQRHGDAKKKTQLTNMNRYFYHKYFIKKSYEIKDNE